MKSRQFPWLVWIGVVAAVVVGCGKDEGPEGPQNTAPTAAFTVGPSSGTTATTFQFDASGSSDGQDPTPSLEVRWDWENDGTWDTEYSTTKTASHQYATLGTKTVKVEVKDTGGLTDTETLTVAVGNGPPSADFAVAPESGTTATVFEFDASGSTDTEDPISALEVRWDWESDGTWDTEYSTTKTASHQYATPGTKTITLGVKDTGGLTSTVTHAVPVGNGPPAAVFTVAPESGTTATVFAFDASGSSDTEDPASALEVRWDWENDGTWDTSYSTTKTASHQYGTTGTKTVKLEVKDAEGLTDTETLTVPVGNGPPTATFTVGPSSGTTATVFEFDASGSTDAEDPTSVLEVRWDWDDDGIWDTDYTTAKTASHQYATLGVKTIKLEVKDTGGLTATETHTVTVGNSAPLAAFTVEPSLGTLETTFQFDASSSSDGEDLPSTLQVRWDWDDDGIWDTDYTTAKTASHQYATLGVKTIKLEVKDAGGLTDTETHTVTVSNTAPTAAFTVDPSSGTVETTFQFDASGSTDTEDPTSVLQVRWDWENDGTWDTDYTTTKAASHQYGTPGTKTIKLEVKDTGGLTGIETHMVTVNNTAPTAYFTVDPSSGTVETAFQVNASGSSDGETPSSGLEVRWDWEDDGAWDTDYTTTKTASHQYSTPGTKTIRLEVKDTGGLTATETHMVTVSNTAPTASFTVDPSSGTVATVFEFDASGSADMEDPTSALQVRWDWENDGAWDTSYSTTKTASHQYATLGTKTIKLEVKDSGGLTDTETRMVSVDNGPPTAAFTVDPSSGTTETVFEFDASTSTDTEDPTSALQIRWDWENDGAWDTSYSTTKTANHQFGTTGTKTVKLEVKDTDGLLDTETHTVGVTGDEGLVLVQPGTFTMGSPPGELCRQADETQHQVTLTHAFYVSATEITQAQWQATMGWDDSSFEGPNRPVEQVTWFDAVRYCNLRSTVEGLTPVYTITGASYSGNHITSASVTWNQSANGYRLLTEAEWQYTCRAGSTGAFCNGGISQCGCGSEPNLGAVGWYCGNSNNQTHDVGAKSPNAWGLYDMHGNVWEWCWDWWYGSYGGTVTDPTGPASGTFRVGLGGCWGGYDYNAEHCRSAHRDYDSPGIRYSYLGLRVARTAS